MPVTTRILSNNLHYLHNVYSCVNSATNQVIASRYQVACASSNSASLSHHTAFEYHGVANQVYYEMYVSSDTRFRNFEFEEMSYKHVVSKMNDGVIEPKHSEGIRVTNLECTVVDSIKDLEKISGLEEVLSCISAIHFLDKEKLASYLGGYDMQFLYQKTGFLLEHYLIVQDIYHTKQSMKAFITVNGDWLSLKDFLI